MTKPRVPRALLAPVVDYFKPQRVILFGSRARGEATRDSDIDLLVIVDDDTPPEKLTWKAGYEAYRTNRPADVFPMRSETFERDRAIANTLAAEADADGIVVYGSPKGSCMKAPHPRARWQAVNDWLAVANEDRRVAGICLTADPPLRGIAAFHCQQAVEKLFKGFLTLAGKRGGKTHSLRELGGAAAASFPEIGELAAASKDWSDWATDFRYPSRGRRSRLKAPPDDDELRRALEVIDALATRLKAANPEPPENPSRRAPAERSSE
ncbi:MAG: HEPN domain-containing protein [Alphaproteobacteria bacterium]|nr:HEPN domain-containing protein [Alphaproteobacteria bacterium]